MLFDTDEVTDRIMRRLSELDGITMTETGNGRLEQLKHRSGLTGNLRPQTKNKGKGIRMKEESDGDASVDGGDEQADGKERVMDIKDQGRSTATMTEEERQKMCDLYGRGMKACDIARELGFSPKAMSSLIWRLKKEGRLGEIKAEKEERIKTPCNMEGSDDAAINEMPLPIKANKTADSPIIAPTNSFERPEWSEKTYGEAENAATAADTDKADESRDIKREASAATAADFREERIARSEKLCKELTADKQRLLTDVADLEKALEEKDRIIYSCTAGSASYKGEADRTKEQLERAASENREMKSEIELLKLHRKTLLQMAASIVD